jgi:GTP1/Obg family GTP-binding protein
MTLNYHERMKQQAEQRISFEIRHKVNESRLRKTYSLLQNFFSGIFELFPSVESVPDFIDANNTVTIQRQEKNIIPH